MLDGLLTRGKYFEESVNSSKRWMIQITLDPTLLKGNVSMLGEEGLNLLLANQADNLLDLAFGGIILKALRAGLNSSWGHTWPSGLSLPNSGQLSQLIGLSSPQSCP